MVSLINHEYSRREAHGRLAWQSMPSNVCVSRARSRASVARNGWAIHQSEYTVPLVHSFGAVPCAARLIRGQTSFAMSSIERRASAGSVQS